MSRTDGRGRPASDEHPTDAHPEPGRPAPAGLRTPVEFWEERYLTHRDERGQVWSGRVNPTVEHEVAGLASGTALELGSGEGGDALWLAERGWSVTALDISATALAVGATQAAARGLTDRVTWMQTDLESWDPETQYDLVTSAFLHAPFDFPRERILRRATAAVAPGGRLLIVGHAAPPPRSAHRHEEGGGHVGDGPPLPTPDEVLAALDLPRDWSVERCTIVARAATLADGTTVDATDTVVRVRRPL